MANSFNEIFGKNLKRDCLLEHVPKHLCQIPCQIVRNVTYMIHADLRARNKKEPQGTGIPRGFKNICMQGCFYHLTTRRFTKCWTILGSKPMPRRADSRTVPAPYLPAQTSFAAWM